MSALSPIDLNNIREQLVTLATKRLIGLLAAKFPLLSVGPIGWFVSIFVTKILDTAFQETFIGAAILYSESQTSKKLKEINLISDEIKNTPKELLKEKSVEFDEKLSNAYLNIIEF